MAGGSAANLASASQRAGGDDLAGAVAVGGVQAVALDRGDHLVGVAAEDGAHAGRLQRAGGGHLAAADAGQGDGGLGGQHPGEGGGAELTDAVPGDQADVVHRQVLGGQQGGRDEQGLGAGGVLDLVGVGRGAEVDQVDPGQRGPPAQAGLGAGQVEPGREEAGLLGTLAGREDGEHVVDSSGCGGRSAVAARDQTLRPSVVGFLQRPLRFARIDDAFCQPDSASPVGRAVI